MQTGLYTFRITTSGTVLHRVHWRDLCATHCASQKLSASAWQKLLGTHAISHHIAWCPCTAYTKFSCLRKSLDGASLFVSAIAIQLTPSYTSYTTHYFQTIEESSDAAWWNCYINRLYLVILLTLYYVMVCWQIRCHSSQNDATWTVFTLQWKCFVR